jgi:hypothetical protein
MPRNTVTRDLVEHPGLLFHKVAYTKYDAPVFRFQTRDTSV